MSNEPTKNIEIYSLDGCSVKQIIKMFKEYEQRYGGSAIYRYKEYRDDEYFEWSYTETRTSLDVRISNLKED